MTVAVGAAEPPASTQQREPPPQGPGPRRAPEPQSVIAAAMQHPPLARVLPKWWKIAKIWFTGAYGKPDAPKSSRRLLGPGAAPCGQHDRAPIRVSRLIRRRALEGLRVRSGGGGPSAGQHSLLRPCGSSCPHAEPSWVGTRKQQGAGCPRSAGMRLESGTVGQPHAALGRLV